MKKYIISLIVGFCAFSIISYAQSTTNDVQIGSVFKIGKPTKTMYKHIQFPKSNMIIKRGGVVNYKELTGKLVVVSSIHEKKNGLTLVRLKLKNGKRFFGSHVVVTAHANKAIKSGELHVLNSKKEQ